VTSRPAARAERSLEPRARPVQPRGARTLGRILDAAAAILKVSGVQGLTMQALAREAHVAVGTVYRLFPNKEAVVCRLYEDRVAQVRVVAETMRVPGRDWRDTFTLYMRALKEAEHSAEFDQSLADAVFLIPEIRRIDARHAVLMADGLADFLRWLGSPWSAAALFDLGLAIYCLDAATWQYAYLNASDGSEIYERLIDCSMTLAAPAIEGAPEPVNKGASRADLLARF
jgi:AcrR family transcriptional regulator